MNTTVGVGLLGAGESEVGSNTYL